MKPAKETPATAVFDNGRRGNPRPGCDCEQCFGYCMIDMDKALRDGFEQQIYGAKHDE